MCCKASIPIPIALARHERLATCYSGRAFNEDKCIDVGRHLASTPGSGPELAVTTRHLLLIMEYKNYKSLIPGFKRPRIGAGNVPV